MDRNTLPLRIGFMLTSLRQPAWRVNVIRDVVGSDFAEVSLFVLNGEWNPEPTVAEEPRMRRRNHLMSLYRRFDGHYFRDEEDPQKSVDFADEFADVPVLEVVPERTKFVHRFSAADIDAIRSYDLDVLVRFGFGILRGDILQAARYGVWSYHHGDNRHYRGGPACFWEVYERNPVSGAILQILTERLDGGKVIYRSFSATHRYSWYVNRKRVYWKATKFVIRRLRDLRRGGWSAIESLDTYREPPGEGTLYRMPTNRQMLPFVARIGCTYYLERLWRCLVVYQWYVACRSRQEPPARIEDIQWRGFRSVPMPVDCFFADPFVIQRDGRTHVFFEDFRFKANKAVISWAALEAGDRLGAVETVLEAGHHLSYPFVFEHAGEVYLMPEAASAKRIDLYRATEFPRRWAKVGTLLSGAHFVDPTAHFDGATWWLFTNVRVDGASSNDELHLYWSDTLFGPWHPHPGNPVKSDVRGARPAGRLFFIGDQLIRPGQNAIRRYGNSIIFHRVDVLTREKFAETAVYELTPRGVPRTVASHTWNWSGGLEVIDGYRWRFKTAAELLKPLRRRLRRRSAAEWREAVRRRLP